MLIPKLKYIIRKASEIEKLQLAYNSTSYVKELLDGAGDG